MNDSVEQRIAKLEERIDGLAAWDMTFLSMLRTQNELFLKFKRQVASAIGDPEMLLEVDDEEAKAKKGGGA
jgi:hypothetical protein